MTTSTIWDAGLPQRRPRLDSCASDVVVVGAGISGLCSALLLARSGRRVVVLEAERIGALASGRTTGKVSLLQGTRIAALRRHHPAKVVAAHLEGERQGLAWLARFCETHDVTHQRRDAFTFAGSTAELERAREEWRAARAHGLSVEWRDHLDVPFEVHGAVALADQLQTDPVALLAALAAELERHGGRIDERSRVVDVSWGRRPTARTADGRAFVAQHLVLATGVPILDRGLGFAKFEARRSYLLAYRCNEQPPGMMLSASRTPRSLRDVPGGTVLVGGAGHVVGRGGSELAGLDGLRAWARSTFPDAVETHAWSAQDYASHDALASVGVLPRGFGRIHLATGYDKWGLASAVAAALRITGGILGSRPEWARPLERRITRPSAAATLIRRNVETSSVAAIGLARALSGGVGAGCAVRAVCTHLGGTLRWNDVERSWDCPLHGSRFTEAGQVIEGPAVHPLRAVD